MNIVGIAGSLRKDSFNAALLRAAVELAPEGMVVEIGSIRGIPLYDGDAEAGEGLPTPVVELKEHVAQAAGLLLVTPEYNHSLPGVFKNAIDWLSRPSKDIERVFGGRPVAVIGATPGRGGTRHAQAAWRPVLDTLGMRVYEGSALELARARGLFDDELRLSDPAARDELVRFLAGFAAFVGAG